MKDIRAIGLRKRNLLVRARQWVQAMWTRFRRWDKENSRIIKEDNIDTFW